MTDSLHLTLLIVVAMYLWWTDSLHLTLLIAVAMYLWWTPSLHLTLLIAVAMYLWWTPSLHLTLLIVVAMYLWQTVCSKVKKNPAIIYLFRVIFVITSVYVPACFYRWPLLSLTVFPPPAPATFSTSLLCMRRRVGEST